MKFAINPMTGEKIYKTYTIISYGYTDNENEGLQKKLPSNCKLLITDCFNDVLAVPSIYQFVNPLALSDKEFETWMEYQKDVNE